MEANIVIKGDSALAQAMRRWWGGLEQDRASRAMLRRCATLDEVVLSPAYQRFYRYMLACGWPAEAANWQNDRLAAIAGLAAWIKTDIEASLPFQMSESVGERPAVSELRFRALLKLETTEELFGSLRRVLPMVGHHASLIQLANDVYWWNDATRKRWAYDYRWPAKAAA